MRVHRIVLIFAVIASSNVAVSPDDTWPIAIDVTVRDFRGAPVAEIPVSASDGAELRVDAMTDSAGKATIELDVPIGTQQLSIAHAFGRPSSFDDEEQMELSKRITELRQIYAIPRAHALPLVATQGTYQVNIVLYEAVTVRGVVVGANDEPTGHSVLGPTWQLADASGRKRFQIKGIRRGAETTVLATSWSPGPLAIVLPIHLTARQTQNDVDLGRVVIPDVNRDASVHVALSNVGAVLGPAAGVTFVKTEGAIMFAVRAYDRRHPQAGTVWGNPVQVPAGRYIVTAGNAAMAPSEEQWALLAAIREGRDLEELGLTTITLDPEHPQTVTFDLAELQEHLRTAFELPGAGAHE